MRRLVPRVPAQDSPQRKELRRADLWGAPGDGSHQRRHKPDKAKLAKVKTVDKHIDRPNRVVLGYIVFKFGWKNVLWLRSIPSTKPDCPPVLLESTRCFGAGCCGQTQGGRWL